MEESVFLKLESFLDTKLHPASFFEVWVSAGRGEVTHAYTFWADEISHETMARRSTHQPSFFSSEDLSFSFPPLLHPTKKFRVSVGDAKSVEVEMPMPGEADADAEAICIDLYGTEPVDVFHPAEGMGYRRRGTCTVLWGDSSAAATAAAIPLEDWAAVHTPLVVLAGGGVGKIPPRRGNVEVKFFPVVEGVEEKKATRRRLLEKITEDFFERAKATLKMDAEGKTKARAIAGVADASPNLPKTCTQRHMLSPFSCVGRETCFLPGSAVGFWMGVGDRGFSASEAWFEHQIALVIRERGCDGLKDDDVLPSHEEGVLVMDAATLWLASQPYMEDRVDYGGEWEQGDTPTNAFVAYGNCKDDARAGCALVSWLIWGVFEGPICRRAQRVARCYVPMLCFGASKPFGEVVSPTNVCSHVYGVCMPVWRAMEMVEGVTTSTSSVGWVETAAKESRTMTRALVLEGTILISSDAGRDRGSSSGGSSPPTIFDPDVWRREENIFEDEKKQMYLMTTSATVPWFFQTGVVSTSETRFWFSGCDAAKNVGVLSRDLFRGSGSGETIVLEKVPFFSIENRDEIIEVRKFERVTRMENFASTPKDLEKFPSRNPGGEVFYFRGDIAMSNFFFLGKKIPTQVWRGPCGTVVAEVGE